MTENTQRDNLRGSAMMCASMAGFTVNDAFMKVVLQALPFYQALFLRAVIVGVLLVVFAKAFGGMDLRLPKRDGWIVFTRTVAEVASAFLFLNALTHMPLANASAIMQALPLTVALAGALFFKEPLGWRRLAAILAGFFGVMLIVRPGADFDFYSLYALGAVMAVTVRDLASRQLSPHVSSLPVSFYATLGNAGFGAAIFLFGGTGTAPWVAISAMQAFLLFGASVSILFGYIFAVSAMRIGALAIVTPFRYTSILFALLLGLVVFGEWPDFLTLIGGGIVVFSGIFTLYREQVAARRAKQNPLGESDETSL